MNFDLQSQPEPIGAVLAVGRINTLFVCGPGRMRSLTAEQVFATRPDLRVVAAGLNVEAVHPVSAELLKWADIIFVMEDVHGKRLAERFGDAIAGKLVVSLDIPDRYEYMDPQLVRLLKTKTAKYLE